MKLLYLMLFCLLALGQAAEYQGYGISFEIPNGWGVAQNNTAGTENDTKIVITDNESAIRIDIISVPELPWVRSISTNDFMAPDLMRGYYQKIVLKQELMGSSSSGSIYRPSPDAIKSMSYGTFDDGMEWFLAWTKDGYGEKFIGVHGLFNGNPEMIVVYKGGSWNASMPVVLYNMLDSMQTNFDGSAIKRESGLIEGI